MSQSWRSEQKLNAFFQGAAITDNTIPNTYEKAFVDNSVTEQSLEELDNEPLTEIRITIIGHRLSILQRASKYNTTTTVKPVTKATVTAKLSELSHEMTAPQFRKFLQDWSVYKQLTQLPASQAAGHLYNACDDAVQTSLINTYPNFNSMDEQTALDTIEAVVTIRVNPAVHRKGFGELMQSEKESIQTFVVRLRSAASDCAFSCPSCEHDLSTINIKDQLIRGLHNATLQAEILAKADQLKTRDGVIKYAEASETALRDQSSLANLSNAAENVFAFQHRNRSRKGKNNRTTPPRMTPPPQPQPAVCKGCGLGTHGPNRATDCDAWGKTCFKCGKPNHLASVCETVG